jgi:RecA-family ATPase
MNAALKKFCLITLLLLTAIAPLTGCSKKSTVAPTDADALPSVSMFAGDLQDIELPTELEWDRAKSMTIKTESFHGGVWHYAGRVEPLSLKNYIISSMRNNKWKLVGEYTASDILLAFVKPNKTCMMVITDSSVGKTKLTLYVTVDRTAAAGLNPFGEAVNQ